MCQTKVKSSSQARFPNDVRLQQDRHDRLHVFMTVVCQGANSQPVALLRNYRGGAPNAKDTCVLFCLPKVLLCDQSAASLFDFSGLEQHGIMQSVTNSAAPWQNGRVEQCEAENSRMGFKAARPMFSPAQHKRHYSDDDSGS